jgi:nucleoside-diphosphate-sugar epimerase
VQGDLGNPSALQNLVKAADIVIHCAGTVRGNSARDFAPTNIQGTSAVISAMASHAPASRLIQLSSLAAREPDLSWYAASKHAGEQLVEASDLNWTIVRPPAVYGPGDEEMKAIFDWLARGICLVPGAIEARVSLVHIDDLVAALLAIVAAGDTHGRYYTPCDGKPQGYTWSEFAGIAADIRQRRVRLLQVPGWAFNGVAAINLFFARLTGRPAMLTPPKVRELRHPDWTTSNEALIHDCGWQPSIGLETGLRAFWASAL